MSLLLLAAGLMLAAWLTGATTKPANALSATAPDQCLGSIHLHGDVFRNGTTVSMDVTSDAAVDCPLLFTVYKTHNHDNLQEGPQDLITPYVSITIHPGQRIKMDYPASVGDCALQVDTFMGYTGPVYNPLTYSPQYGSEFLGPNHTYQGEDCNEVSTPTPTATPTRVVTVTPTPTLPPPPTIIIIVTPTATPVVPTPTATPVVVTPTATSTKPPATPTATPTKGTPVNPPAVQTPHPPTAGTGVDPAGKGLSMAFVLFASSGLALGTGYIVFNSWRRRS